MPNLITCPKCGHAFDSSDSIREEVERELNVKAKEWRKQKEQELEQEKQAIKKELEATLKKQISQDTENQLRLLEEQNKEKDERLKKARQQELEFLRREQALKTREEELEVATLRRIQEEREKLKVEIQQQEAQKNQAKETEQLLKMRELEKKLEQQTQLAEEMKRKMEQGSMQLQGESQELLLEEQLRAAFPFDLVEEVGKGVEGADCILVVRDQGQECGKIIFESKRTRNWSQAWISKLKNDMRNKQADLAVLVSQVYPKGQDCFAEKEGVWIASFREFIPLTIALRNAIINISHAKKSEENKGEKMQMLYHYLTGTEFRQSMEAIVDGFMSMKNSITKERVQMEKLWKEREKQLEKVLISTSGLYGSIRGIAGSSIQEIPLLESGSNELENGEES